MTEELLDAIKGFSWNKTPEDKHWKIHYNPKANGAITSIGQDGTTDSTDPFILVESRIGKDFIEGKKYSRSYHVVHETLTMKTFENNIFEASDNRLGAITKDDTIEPGVYFITVKGDPDLVIDTLEVTADNLDAESKRIKEYLENNDCYKDK
jgi:hypothetical protein